MSNIRSVKVWPALIKFFHSNAVMGGPMGRRVNGGRLLLRFWRVACRLPERTAATFSASFWEASTEASSNATLERSTQT